MSKLIYCKTVVLLSIQQNRVVIIEAMTHRGPREANLPFQYLLDDERKKL